MSIGCVLLALNVFSAIQDIAVDGLALQILPDDQLGLGNTIQVSVGDKRCIVPFIISFCLLCWYSEFKYVELWVNEFNEKLLEGK